MAPPRRLTAIVAATIDNGIGIEGGLPWRLPGEMKYFARGTYPLLRYSDSSDHWRSIAITTRKQERSHHGT